MLLLFYLKLIFTFLEVVPLLRSNRRRTRRTSERKCK